MKKLTVIVAASSLMGLGLAVDSSAQTRPAAPPADQPRMSTPRQTFHNTQGLFESSAIIGMRVKNATGKDMGEIDYLLIDPNSGKVTHAVIGVGGMMGVGETHVVVPWSDVRISGNPMDRSDRPVVSMDPTVLERAPRYEGRAAAETKFPAPSASPRMDRPAGTTADRPAGSPPATAR
jgi:sporulation protein YlmC with PRC-barrel domain